MAQLRLSLVGVITVVTILVVAESPTQGTADQFKPSLDSARKDEGELVRDNCRAHGRRIEPIVCVYGRRDSEKKVVLFGDSHALQWGPALIHQGRNLSRKASEPRLRLGMVRTIKRLKRIGSLVRDRSAVTLIRDQVPAPFVPADCLKANRGKTSRCVFRKQRRFGPGFDWIAAKRTGIGPAVDPARALCGRKWCSSTRGKILKYRDSDHITATYARGLSGWFDQRLGIR